MSFQFKEFFINDDQCAMKVGTDSILLGSWVKHENPNDVLDIGAGSGLLSLMMAQRFPNSSVTAIEVDPKAASQCMENMNNSRFKTPFRVLCEDFLKFETDKKFDLIVTNPPFFDSGIQKKNNTRDIARHGSDYFLGDLIKRACKLLRPKGKLYIIIPQYRLAFIKSILEDSPTEITRLCKVYPLENKDANRFLLQINNAKDYKEERITIYKSHGIHSKQFSLLTKSYYL